MNDQRFLELGIRADINNKFSTLLHELENSRCFSIHFNHEVKEMRKTTNIIMNKVKDLNNLVKRLEDEESDK